MRHHTARRAIFVAVLVGSFGLGTELEAAEVSSVDEPTLELRRHTGRALIETGVVVGLGLFWYWLDYMTARDPYEYPFAFDTFRHKLTDLDYTRFDTSSPFHNALGHAYAGSLYYNAWRSNGFGPYGAALANLTVSLLWEYVVEYRENASINDLIVTNFGGFAAGEASAQLAQGLVSEVDSLPTTVIATLIAPFSLVNHALDGDKSALRSFAGRLRAHASAGAGLTSYPDDDVTRFEIELGIQSHVVKSGEGFRFLSPATELHVRGGFNSDVRARFDVYAKNLFLGYLWRGLREGDYLLTGLASTFSYDLHPFPVSRDLVSAVGPIVPSLDGALTLAKVPLRFVVDIAPSFGIVRSFAITSYAETHDLTGTKTTLREHGYYYAYGLTGRARLVARYERFEAGAEGRYARFRSIEGRDRFQREVTNDFALRDRRSFLAASLSYDLGHAGLSLLAQASRYWAKGQIFETVHGIEDRLLLNVVYRPGGTVR